MLTPQIRLSFALTTSIKSQLYIFSLLFIGLLLSCEKKDLPPPTPPAPPTLSLSIENALSSIRLSAGVQNLSKDKIKETGFVWSTQANFNIESNGVYSFATGAESITFSYDIVSTLIKDNTYYVKAYYIDQSNTYHYSEAKSFKANGTKNPYLEFPGEYTWGERAKLTLNNDVNAKSSDVEIFIAPNMVLKPVEIKGKDIFFIVPQELTQKRSEVYVTILGQKSTIQYLGLKSPTITATSATEIFPDTEMTITGNNFNPILALNIVKIGSFRLELLSGSTTSLKVKVTNLLLSELGKLIIQTGPETLGVSLNDFYAYKHFKSQPDFPGEPRTNPVVLHLDGNLYVGLGRSKATSIGMKDWWKLNLNTNTWTRMADCPASAWIVSSFSAGNQGYVGMGNLNGEFSNDFYCYSPATNTWAKIASCPAPVTRDLSTFSTPEAGYLIGGSREKAVPDVWKYTVSTKSWTRLADFPGVPTTFSNTFVIGNKGYYLGGSSTTLNHLRREAWSLNFTTGKWERIADVPQEAGYYYGFSFAIQGKGYLGGGITDKNFSGDTSPFVFEYNPSSNTWIKKDQILELNSRAATGFVSDGNVGYILCGHINSTNFGVGSSKFLKFFP